MPEPVTVTVHRSPLRVDQAVIADTPENRAWLETQAIPKCREWREANREFPPKQIECSDVPAPYCCSAYCIRCAGLRALDGEAQLTPNEWMTR